MKHVFLHYVHQVAASTAFIIKLEIHTQATTFLPILEKQYSSMQEIIESPTMTVVFLLMTIFASIFLLL